MFDIVIINKRATKGASEPRQMLVNLRLVNVRELELEMTHRV